jgi:hypothetical protein
MKLKFNPLPATEIECRVQQVKEKGLCLLLYKTARVDANALDEVVGAMNWQNDFKVINDNLYCGIGILDEDTKNWVWKWDCGTESNTEKEKGEASDSFKRAGFKWGIGRELYSAPFTWISSDKANIKPIDASAKIVKYSTFDKFEVEEIVYDGNKIVALTIKNTTKGIIAFNLDLRKKQKQTAPPKKQTEEVISDNKINKVQVAQIKAEMKRTGVQESVILSTYNLSKFEDMEIGSFDGAMRRFKQTKTKKEEA